MPDIYLYKGTDVLKNMLGAFFGEALAGSSVPGREHPYHGNRNS